MNSKSKEKLKSKNGNKPLLKHLNLLKQFAYNHRILTFIILSIIAVLPYFQTLNYTFQYDDIPTIFEDADTDDISDILNIRLSERPIRKISIIIDRYLFNTNVSPYRVENIILYIISVFLAGIIIYELTKNTMFSFISIIIFALHPIHVSSVLIVTHRKEMFVFIFSILALLSHIRRRNVFSFILFILAVLSKETAIVLPLIFLCYDIIFKKNNFNKKIYIYYLFIFIIGIIIISVFGKYTGFALPNLNSINETLKTNRLFRGVNYYQILLIQPYMICMYLLHLFIPFNLSLDYFIPIKNDYIFIKSISFIIMLVLILLVYIKRKNKYILFAALFFIINYLPASNIIPVANFISDRYMFIGSLSILFVIYIIYKHKNLKFLIIPYIIYILIITLYYIPVYKTDYTLWSYVLKTNNRSLVAHTNLGLYYYNNANASKAIKHYKEALKTDSLYTEALLNLGTVYAKLKWYDMAIREYEKAISVDSNLVKAYYNLGLIHIKLNENIKAGPYMEKVIQIAPKSYIAYNNLGAIYYKDGLDDEITFKIANILYVFPAAAFYLFDIIESYSMADSVFNEGYDGKYEKLKKNIERVNRKIKKRE